MDPLLPADTDTMEREADKDARRKIQFSVPSSVPTQLDPRQVEMVRVLPQTSWVLGENGALKAKLVHMSTYQPPSLKGKYLILLWELPCGLYLSQLPVQRMAQAHLASLDMRSVDREDSSSEEEEEHCDEKKQQTASATGGKDIIVIHFIQLFFLVLAPVPNKDITYTFENPFISDLKEECKPLRDQCDRLGSSTVSSDLSHHQEEAEKAKERAEGKGE
uniref:Protein phosphatase 1 regulatory subunit 1B n=1 Tax=Amphiprion percula TaxID=161767 RepID=A0A3P8TCA0_AMPPE